MVCPKYYNTFIFYIRYQILNILYFILYIMYYILNIIYIIDEID